MKKSFIIAAVATQFVTNAMNIPLIIEPYNPIPRGPNSTTRTVVLVAGRDSISDNAFSYYYALRTITIPASVTIIGSYCFFQNRRLINIDFSQGSNLTRIKNGAFSLCTDLESITLPASVQIIESGCFANCHNLKNVTFSSFWSPIDIKEDAFQNPSLSLWTRFTIGIHRLSYLIHDLPHLMLDRIRQILPNDPLPNDLLLEDDQQVYV